MSLNPEPDPIEKLEFSLLEIIRSLEGFPMEYWTRRPAGEGWSVSMILEHLAIIERNVLSGLRRGGTPAEKLEGLPAASPGLYERIKRRGTKVEAPAVVIPPAEWTDPQAPLVHFQDARSATLQYARESGGPAPEIRMAHARLGAMDVRQWLLFLAAHCERHKLQIDELRAEADTNWGDPPALLGNQ